MKGQNCLEKWHDYNMSYLLLPIIIIFYLQQILLETQERIKIPFDRREIQCLTLIAKNNILLRLLLKR